jgi:hypothetical protein
MTTIWYQRSGRDHDTHRDTLCRGGAQAACGIMFAAYETALPGNPPDPHRICLRCGLGLDEHSEWLALLYCGYAPGPSAHWARSTSNPE